MTGVVTHKLILVTHFKLELNSKDQKDKHICRSGIVRNGEVNELKLNTQP